MRVSTEHERLVRMLKESISLMCKNALTYDVELNVEGLLGITLDKRDIFLININESFQSAAERLGAADEGKDSGDDVEITNAEGIMPQPKKRRKRRTSRESRVQTTSQEQGDGTSSQDLSRDFIEEKQPHGTETNATHYPASVTRMGTPERHSSHVTNPYPGEDAANFDLDRIVVKEEVIQHLGKKEALEMASGDDAELEHRLPGMMPAAGTSVADTGHTSQTTGKSELANMGTESGGKIGSQGTVTNMAPVAQTSRESTHKLQIAAPKTMSISNQRRGGSMVIHQKKFRCSVCGVKFTRRFGLTQHERRQHGMSGGFPCPSCPQVFGQASHLRDHIDVHRSDQLYSCFCGKSFQRKSGLQKHARHCLKHARGRWSSSLLWHQDTTTVNHAVYASCSFEQLPCVPGTSSCQAIITNDNKLRL